MSNDRGGTDTRRLKTGPTGKKFDRVRFLIEVGVAIMAINLLAGFLAWYFLLPRMRH